MVFGWKTIKSKTDSIQIEINQTRYDSSMLTNFYKRKKSEKTNRNQTKIKIEHAYYLVNLGIT